MKNYLPVEHHKKLMSELKPMLRYDGHVPVHEWANICRNKLGELLGMDTFQLCEPEFEITGEETAAEFRLVHFTLQTEEGYYTRCAMLLPQQFEGKLPLCVCLQGHTTGAHHSYGVMKYPNDEQFIGEEVDYGLQAARLGYAVVCVEQRAFGECGGTPKGPACQYPGMQALLMGRTLIGERVWDVMRVVDAVQAHFSDIITMKDSMLIGLSGGGTATYYTACFEHRFDIYVPCCAVCSFGGSIVAMSHCVCNYVPGIAKYFDMGDLAVMIAPKKLLVLAGRHDDGCFPLAGCEEAYRQIEEIYKAAGKPDNCRFVVGEGGHRFYGADVWPVWKELMGK